MLATKLSKTLSVTPSFCSHTGTLSIPGIFNIFMDLAGEHAENLGIGLSNLSIKNLFWVTVKTKVIIHCLPELNSQLTIRTWPEKPGRLRCNRYYEILYNNEIIISGKTEWTILNTQDGSLKKPSEVFPMELTYLEEKCCEENFAKFLDNFTEEPYYTYQVNSTDIDIGQHMNNARYLEMIAGSFSCAEWDALDIHEIDVAYKSSCFEKDILNLQKRITDQGMELRVSDSSDNRTVLLSLFH